MNRHLLDSRRQLRKSAEQTLGAEPRTNVKIFVPEGFETVTPEDYLYVSRIVLQTEATSNMPWVLLKEYTNHTEHPRIIIASIPDAALTHIQTNGTETDPETPVWEIDGFLGPLELTLATPWDLRTIRTPTPNAARVQPSSRFSK
jgi:hypothetical protein